MPPSARKTTPPKAAPDEAQAATPVATPASEPAPDATASSGHVPRLIFSRLEEVVADHADILSRLEAAETLLKVNASFDPEDRTAILGAIFGIMKDVHGIGKHGVMAPEGGGYAFRKYDDLKREIGAACRRHGVALQAETLELQRERVGRMVYVTVKVRYAFTSLADGSTMSFSVYGEGSSTTDKATGKAMTMALKTALDQLFLLAAEDIEDPDATNEEPDPPRPQERAYPRSYGEGDPLPPAGHPVGGRREVTGQVVKHDNGPPKDQTDPWDQGPPADTRTSEEKAQAAADALNRPGLTMTQWSAISQHAQDLGLFEIPVSVSGQTMALKHHMIAVGRTL